MLQVGKKYRVVEPESAAALGLADVVKILREEKGMFLGDNETWYLPNGKCSVSDPFRASDSIHLTNEIVL